MQNTKMSDSERREEKERRAARNALKRAYKKKMNKGKILGKIFGIPAAIVLIGACIISMAIDYSEFGEKQEELKVLENKAAELEAENAAYQSILDEEDERTYMERIAIEKLGYAYPNERRFYDTTRS